MTDQRILTLIKQRSVRCNLRRQPADISQMFYTILETYSLLWIRADKGTPPVKGLLNELYNLLKFVALPNNKERKRGMIERKWPSLKERIDAL